MVLRGLSIAIVVVTLADVAAAAGQVGLDRPLTFYEIASEQGIKLEHLAEKLNLDAKAIRFRRPQDVGLTAADVEKAVEGIKAKRAQVAENTITTLVSVLLVSVIAISVLASITVLLLKLRFGNRVQAGDW